uniref:Tubulin tyrosine ligase-like family, member 10 n=1 Tax=Salarias fasciatus TaxID=181472 RepID=A0A672GHA2_SALFA
PSTTPCRTTECHPVEIVPRILFWCSDWQVAAVYCTNTLWDSPPVVDECISRNSVASGILICAGRRTTTACKARTSTTIHCKDKSVLEQPVDTALDVPHVTRWTLKWTSKYVHVEYVKTMLGFQRNKSISHESCNKNVLSKNMNRMLKLFTDNYRIFPTAWCLPGDYNELMSYANSKNETFICKPNMCTQGKGGFKFYLQIYILETSCDPLRVFMFEEGLAHWCTIKHSEPTPTNVDQRYMLLCDFAINRKKILLFCVCSHCFTIHPSGSSCFALLGSDILLDHDLRPWVLEMNCSPSLLIESRVGREMKELLLNDTILKLQK